MQIFSETIFAKQERWILVIWNETRLPDNFCQWKHFSSLSYIYQHNVLHDLRHSSLYTNCSLSMCARADEFAAACLRMTTHAEPQITRASSGRAYGLWAGYEGESIWRGGVDGQHCQLSTCTNVSTATNSDPSSFAKESLVIMSFTLSAHKMCYLLQQVTPFEIFKYDWRTYLLTSEKVLLWWGVDALRNSCLWNLPEILL